MYFDADSEPSLKAAATAWKYYAVSRPEAVLLRQRHENIVKGMHIFVVENRADVAALLASSRRIGLSDAARYCALDTLFLVYSRLPHCFTGPRSRYLGIATCLSLAVKLVERAAVSREIVSDQMMTRHNVRSEDVAELEEDFFKALEGHISVPPWWSAIESTLDTVLATTLISSGVSFHDRKESSLPRGPLTLLPLNDLPDVSASRKQLHDSSHTFRRRGEAALRLVGLIVDRVIIVRGVSNVGKRNLDGQRYEASSPSQTQRDFPISRDNLNLWADPAIAFACIVLAGFGMCPEDASLFNITPESVRQRVIDVSRLLQ